MYKLVIREKVDKRFFKLSKKNKPLMKIVDKKILQIRENPYRFKPLRKPLQNKRRVHIGKSFVLIYSINETKKIVTIEHFDHHDFIYKHG